MSNITAESSSDYSARQNTDLHLLAKKQLVSMFGRFKWTVEKS